MNYELDPLALCATVIALAALVWNIVREKPHVKVRVEKYIDYDVDDPFYKGDIEIITTNKTRRTIRIQEIGFMERFGERGTCCALEQYSPFKVVNAEDSFTYQVMKETIEAYQSVGQAKYFAFAYVIDGVNKLYKGKIPKDVKMILRD